MDPRLPFLALADVPSLPRLQVHQLLARYGSPEAVFGRPAAELRALCAPAAAAALARGPDLARARVTLERAQGLGMRVCVGDERPPALARIPDPPLVLYLRGRVPSRVLAGPALAIVGARRASPRGREVARRLGAAAARAGVTVVSGLAYGIDAAAQAGALQGGGASVAVLAGGLDLPSPRGNLRLARALLERGGWISEHPPGTAALPHRFPERNRLISGLCACLLVVEAGERSGSMWTVRHAIDQGRDVLAVPGPVDTASCRGSNHLIRDGAGVILGEDDLLGWLQGASGGRGRTEGEAKPQPHPDGFGPPPSPAPGPASPTERRILEALESAPAHPDALSRQLGLAPSELAAALLDLELAGRIRRQGPLLALAEGPPADGLSSAAPWPGSQHR